MTVEIQPFVALSSIHYTFKLVIMDYLLTFILLNWAVINRRNQVWVPKEWLPDGAQDPNSVNVRPPT